MWSSGWLVPDALSLHETNPNLSCCAFVGGGDRAGPTWKRCAWSWGIYRRSSWPSLENSSARASWPWIWTFVGHTWLLRATIELVDVWGSARACLLCPEEAPSALRPARTPVHSTRIVATRPVQMQGTVRRGRISWWDLYQPSNWSHHGTYFKNAYRLYNANHPLDHVMGHTFRMYKDCMIPAICPLDHVMGHTFRTYKDCMIPAIHTLRMYKALLVPTTWSHHGIYFNPFIHYCSHVVTKFNARVIYTYGI